MQVLREDDREYDYKTFGYGFNSYGILEADGEGEIHDYSESAMGNMGGIFNIECES